MSHKKAPDKQSAADREAEDNNAFVSTLFRAVRGGPDEIRDAVRSAPPKRVRIGAATAAACAAALAKNRPAMEALFKKAASMGESPWSTHFEPGRAPDKSQFCILPDPWGRSGPSSYANPMSGLPYGLAGHPSSIARSVPAPMAILLSGLVDEASWVWRNSPEPSEWTLQTSVQTRRPGARGHGHSSSRVGAFALWAACVRMEENPSQAKGAFDFLVSQGFDPFSSPRRGVSPLSIACACGHDSLALILLENPLFEHKGDISPLSCSLEAKNRDMFSICLQSGLVSASSGVGISMGLSPLETSVAMNDAEAFHALREAGARAPKSVTFDLRGRASQFSKTFHVAPPQEESASMSFRDFAEFFGAGFASACSEEDSMESELAFRQKKAHKKMRREERLAPGNGEPAAEPAVRRGPSSL